MVGYKQVRIKQNTNDEACLWYKADLTDEKIIKDHELKGGKKQDLMFENKPDVNLILSLGYKCYKYNSKRNEYIPYIYNTLFDASNFNVMQPEGIGVFFFKTENFETEKPIVIGLHVVGVGVQYISLPKDFEYLKYKIYD
jgi:hypothetical protein